MSFGAPRIVSLKNVIRHHDGCRLAHPAKWDICSMPYTIMTDADWCIPPGGSFGVSIRLQFDLSFTFIRFSNITFQFHIHFRIIFSKIYSIYVLISYAHSHTHFIYSFMYSFHIYLVNYQNTRNKNRVREQTNY